MHPLGHKSTNQTQGAYVQVSTVIADDLIDLPRKFSVGMNGLICSILTTTKDHHYQTEQILSVSFIRKYWIIFLKHLKVSIIESA